MVLGVLGGLIIAVVAGVVWLYPSVAPVSGTHQVANLADTVVIKFDQYERPFVRAKTFDDALFAQGWLHAHHRLWQMEMFRRAGEGRLAELLGSSMLDADKELWRMGIPQLGEQLEENATPEMRVHVAAYVNGINAALNSAESKPPEFLLLQAKPAPWTARDVYALGALMAFQSANNSGNELLRLALFNELDEARAELFLPQDGNHAEFPYVLEKISMKQVSGVLTRMAATDPTQNPLMPSFAFGSNGWVVAPSKSKTGNALFAFDSHDAFGLPNLFYEIHLFFAGDQQLRGWSVAGLPGVINGYNERVAWGFTNIGDTQDLFLETRSETDPLQFKDGDQWYTARTETVKIPVSGREQDEDLTITHTINGPLISENPPISLSWSVQHLDGKGIDCILKFNRAMSCDEYARALDDFAAPSLNATFADIDGNIGFRTAGLIPIRGAGNGLIPSDGADPANRWQGFVPPQALPTAVNPEAGYLAAANARVNAAGNGPLVSADNAPGYRIRRIQQVLSSRSDFTVDDMRELQTDWYDGQAALLMPAMLASVDRETATPIVGAAIDLLDNWRGNWIADPDQAAPIIFQAWYRALAVEVFQPGLSGDLYDHLFRHNYPLNHALDRLILDEPDNPWWRGERELIVSRSLAAALEQIRGIQGDKAENWRLDRMHAIKIEHELGKAVPQLAWFFNAKPAPWGGGPATVGRARYRYDRAYDATAGATMRVVGEMKQPAADYAAVIPGGQSGHPLSNHYQDQLPHWLNRVLLPISASDDQVVGDVQTLVPAP